MIPARECDRGKADRVGTHLVDVDDRLGMLPHPPPTQDPSLGEGSPFMTSQDTVLDEGTPEHEPFALPILWDDTDALTEPV